MHILLVEDDDDHALLTTRAIRQAAGDMTEPLSVTRVGDGAAALAYVHGQAAGQTFPDLVLLDLKLPEVSGLDVLRALRADPRTRLLPVVVLTTSGLVDDVHAAYALGANEYVTKPMALSEFRNKIRAIPIHWSQVVQRPSLGAA